MSNKSHAESRENLAQAQLDFFENELAFAETLSDVAKTRYSMGHTEGAERAKQEALTAIRTVRDFLEKTHLIARETISAFSKRCDEHELLVNSVRRTK